MTIDPAAYPFVLIAAGPALICLLLGWPIPAAFALVLPVAIALFFRDPSRTSPADAALVLAPADGRVMHAGPARRDEAPAGEWGQITIFLSLFDVHINRAPVSGRITRVDYLPGTFLAAYRQEAHQNERSEIWIDHAGTSVVARQVVGVLARRVVTRIRPNDVVAAGDRIGLMKFGSRMDVFVPANAVITVKPGESVRAGVTVIARLVGERTPALRPGAGDE